MEHLNKDPYVAHYSSLKNLANILHDTKLVLSPVSRLSDPRESSMSWIDTCGIGTDIDIKGRTEAEKLKSLAGQYLKILSTVAPKERRPEQDFFEATIFGRPRMWAQYGGNSEGFCVILNRKTLTQAIRKNLLNENHLQEGPIDYIPWSHMVGGGISLDYGLSLRPNKQSLFDLINANYMLKSIYFKKGSDWVEENEYRWLLYSESFEPYFVDISDAIQAVVLGSRFPLNQVPQAKTYCKALACDCYQLNYEYPKYGCYPIYTHVTDH